jgi:hypothetical protein
MRTTMRIGRGLYITGGGGVFAFALGMTVMRGVLMLALFCVAIALVTAFAFAMTACQHSSSTRRLLATRALAMSVRPDLVRIQGNRSEPPVVGLYAIGSEFVTGNHPRKRIDLERLYPERASRLVCVGLFPDAATANAAKRRLVHDRFSARELNKLFLPA